MTKPARVLLASMPFGPIFSPSIALGLLAAALTRDRIPNASRYFTIDFAKRIGLDRYAAVSVGSVGSHFLLGEWLFRDALFGGSSVLDDAYLELLRRQGCFGAPPEGEPGAWRTPDDFARDAQAIRGHVESFLSDAVADVLRFAPTVLGLTSVFQQHVASLALAKRIKDQAPNVFVVFGGANCEDVMGRELLAQFPFVDFVVSGEGDAAFPALVEDLAGGGPGNIPGVLNRASGRTYEPTTIDLETLPIPAYDEYFEQWSAVFGPSERHYLPFETSRGCWWGAKHHCTFCGLNGSTMAFRKKSAGRAIAELEHLVAAHPNVPVSVVDNILDMRYFDDLVPALAAREKPVSLFYEVKANLTKGHVRALRDANVMDIQPGIESLHDSVLRLMRKGVSVMQSLQLLKWCAELGVRPHWNLIWGFPGEDPVAYEAMAELVPSVRHLEPPETCGAVRLDRFSPNFNEAHERGIRDVRPFEAYDIVYDSLGDRARRNLAYYFDFRYEPPQAVDAYTAPLRRAVERWRNERAHWAFFYLERAGRFVLFDARRAEPRVLGLDPTHSAIYAFCDSAKSLDQIAAAFAHLGLTADALRDDLDGLVCEGAMLALEGRYLSLAVRAGTYSPSVEVLTRMHGFFKNAGRENEDGELSVPLREYKTPVRKRSQALDKEKPMSDLHDPFSQDLSLHDFEVRGNEVIIKNEHFAALIKKALGKVSDSGSDSGDPTPPKLRVDGRIIFK